MVTTTGKIAAAVLEAVKKAGRKGATADDIMALGFSRTSVTPRLADLTKAGAIVKHGFRATRQGTAGTVYKIKGKTKAAPKVKVPAPAPAPAALKSAAEIAHEKTAAAPASPAPVAPVAPAAPPEPVAPPRKLKNHFILVSDHSYSMDAFRAGAAKLFNKQVETILATKDQDSSVTVYEFGVSGHGSGSIRELRYNAPPSQVARYAEDGSDYLAVGNTPLYAAVVKAGQRALCDRDPSTSFVMLVLTDGEENQSPAFGIHAHELREFIRTQQGTDRWTFVFLVPKGYKARFVSESGVFEGNVREWDDIEKAREEVTSGLRQYAEDRRSGARSSKNWFQTDLSKIAPADLSRLKDITSDVRSWAVEKESEVMTFVNYKTGGRFKPGVSFFEIHKKEREFQDYKKLILFDKVTGRYYADGPTLTVRSLCGFPASGTVAIDPVNHASFLLLGQSMSTNRLLGRGTRLVFWEAGAN
jgi:hypothetical protein